MTQPVRILTVCTGNVCRSPAAERFLAARLGDAAEVRSAGIGALVGQPIDPSMAELMQADGVSPDGFQARQLTYGLIGGTDLLLPLATEHRAWIVREEPAAMRKTFTLLEFAHLLDSVELPAADPAQDGADYLRSVIRALGMQRARAPRRSNGYDVDDPYRRERSAFELAWNEIKGAGDTIATRLGRGR